MFLEKQRGKKMKNKRILGIFLVLLMLVLTACGGKKDTATESTQGTGIEQGVQNQEQENTIQENESGVQEEKSEENGTDAKDDESDIQGSDLEEQSLTTEAENTEEDVSVELPIEGQYYYDVVNVVLYLELYGELPANYITKNEAQALGWQGGSVEQYKAGAAIGGDGFGNREGLLPEASGRKYTECDINTNGRSSRGSKRLVFSNDGLYFYTSDHYESFSEITVTEDYEVIW